MQGEDGHIQSPKYPADYPGYLLCHVTIRAPTRQHRILIVFTQIDIEVAEDNSCNNDNLEVR